MPRAFPRGVHTPKKRPRIVSKRSRASKKPPEELEALLESQLLGVVDPIEPAETPFSEPEPVPPTTPHQDTARDLDAGLISSLSSPSVEQKGDHRVRKPVRIRFAEHEASPHVLRGPRQVRTFSRPVRTSMSASIREWVAPYETPPSPARLISEVQDLHIASVDPRVFAEQFTPADPDVAYRRQFGVLAKLREPFIHWDVVFVKRVRTVVPRSLPLPSSSAEPIHINVSSLMAEQFTEAIVVVDVEDVPVKTGKPWYARAWDWMRRSEKRVAEEAEVIAHEVKDREEELITQTEEAWGVPMVVPRLVPHRVIIGLFGLMAIVSLPAGAVSLSRSFGATYQDIRARSNAAVEGVQTALSGPQGDTSAWMQASHRFQEADQALSQVNAVAVALAQALPQTRDRLQSAHALLQAGDKATQAARLLSQGLNKALSQPVSYADERLQILMTYLDAAAPQLEEAERSIQEVALHRLPTDVQSQVAELREALTLGQKSLQDLQSMSRLALAALGHDRPRTYLFLFQNQTELRPTGGFMGSYAEVVFDRGNIKRLTVPGGGPYDLRDQLKVRVLPPKPLQLVSSRWEFQDANWFPDFPTAAEKIRWFWSNAGQPTLDGVVAINASVLQKLLTVTGPIEMSEYGKTITAENVMLETQKAVELEYDKTENKPKKFIGDLMPKVMERMQGASQEEWIKYAGVFAEALETKDIQIALTDKEEEALVEAWGWNGRLAPTPGDMLAVIEANIAGQKTDGVIDERVHHEASIQADGSIIDTVTLERTHTGEAGELFRGANNVAYVRVYVPQGSELLSAAGFQPPLERFFDETLATDPVDPDIARLIEREVRDPATSVVITDEFGYTAFGGWVQLAPGAQSTTTFRYRLPFTAQQLARSAASGTTDLSERAAYLLLLTSQSGKANRTITSSVQVPNAWRASWSHTPFASSTPLTWDRDRVVAHLFESSHDETAQTSP